MTVSSRHLNIRYHFLKELIEAKTLDIGYIPSNDNIPDIGTKPMCGKEFTAQIIRLMYKNNPKLFYEAEQAVQERVLQKSKPRKSVTHAPI